MILGNYVLPKIIVLRQISSSVCNLVTSLTISCQIKYSKSIKLWTALFLHFIFGDLSGNSISLCLLFITASFFKTSKWCTAPPGKTHVLNGGVDFRCSFRRLTQEAKQRGSLMWLRPLSVLQLSVLLNTHSAVCKSYTNKGKVMAGISFGHSSVLNIITCILHTVPHLLANAFNNWAAGTNPVT